jgi:hypothetical protein
MFDEIEEIAQTFGCIFTLYVDDMTFSSIDPIPLKNVIYQITYLLRRYGHRPKKTKIKYYTKNQFKPITGTVINSDHHLLVPNNLQQKIYENFQTIKKTEFDIVNDTDSRLLMSLKGQIQSAQRIQQDIFPEIARLTNMTQTIEQTNPAKPIKRSKIIKIKRLA